MPLFNTDGRVNNSLKTSTCNLITQIIVTLLNFAYRTIFIKVLAVEYLGLNGLFTDILSLLSLAELGIGSSIAFRLYKPISINDVEHVAKLMNFYKQVYRVIAAIITVIGLAIMPAIPYIIKDSGSLPQDMNLYILYALFLFQSVSGYFFAYKQTLLHADQKGYSLTLYNFIATVLKFIGQITILLILKSYMYTLVFSILTGVLSNFIISIIVTKKYREVFILKLKISRDEMKEIGKDTSALMLHKVGSVVLSSTDSIVITAMIGLAVNGILSNYLIILTVIKTVFTQIFGSLGAGFGNLCASSDLKNIRRVFYNTNFIVLWITGFFAIGLFALSTPFITVWLNDPQYLLNEKEVLLLVMVNSFGFARCVPNSMITAAGEFRRDKLRPIIEAALNLGISLLAAHYLGLVGVYIGTIASFCLTAFWREPYICYKHILKDKLIKYWLIYFGFALMTLATGYATYIFISMLPGGIFYLILKFLFVLIIPNLVFTLFTWHTKEFKYAAGLAIRILKSLSKKFSGSMKRAALLVGIEDPVADDDAISYKEIENIAKSRKQLGELRILRDISIQERAKREAAIDDNNKQPTDGGEEE